MTAGTAKTAAEIRQSLREIIEACDVLDKPASLKDFKQGPAYLPAGKPVALVKPRTAEQVRELVELANRLDLNLVPVSSGAPHLRGDTLPGKPGVLVDLSANEQIVRMDRRNKVAIIEPGVTFGTLKQAAEKVGLKVLMPLMSRATKSVLASCLEREPITIPKYHWDMTDPLLCTEVIFGSGDLFRTGSAAGPGTLEQQWAAGAAQKNPMGPAQTDLVRIVQGAQGTMGIVTWASVKLEVLPQIERFYFAPEKHLPKLIDFTYRTLKPKLGDEFLLLNSFALACMLGSEAEDIRDLASRQAPFTAIYGVSGLDYLPERRLAYQEKDIGSIAQACGVELKMEVPGASGKKFGELLGSPSPEPYWKMRFKGGFHDIFFLTTLDRTGFFLEKMEGLAAEHRYPVEELGVYIQPIQHGRACHLEFNLSFNPEDPEESAHTQALFLAASAALADAGAFFSRPYGPWAALAYECCPDTVAMLKTIKGIFDPAGVMNRGKLCF